MVVMCVAVCAGVKRSKIGENSPVSFDDVAKAYYKIKDAIYRTDTNRSSTLLTLNAVSAR
jgi:hypothetical protein